MPVKTTKKSRKKVHKKSKIQRTNFKKQLFRPGWPILALILLISGGLYYQSSANKPILLPSPPADALYKQPDQPTDKRVKDLLARMTIEEKLGQMAMVDKNSLIKPIDISRYNLGAVLSGAGAKPAQNTPEGWLKMVENMKTKARQSRLGIPLLYGVDATHGHANVPGSTVFPHAIGLGASQSPELVKEIASATARELEATGINWNFAPALDTPEDIRWGRTYENFSSDPKLNARLGAAYIEGTQHPANSKDDYTYVLASAKHFLAAGSMQWLSSSNKNFRIDQGKTPVRDDLLDNEYLEPFAAAAKANVGSVMVGLNHWGDKRVIASKHLITDKLKNDLGFKGIVLSDWYGVYEFSGISDYHANIEAINAGVDMAMLPFEYKNFIKDTRKAVKTGDIAQSRIDDAVSRILYQKFEAGLFDNKSSQATLDTLGLSEHRQLARRAVSSSAVLLKNDSNVLPLPKNSGHILVAGSGADNIGRQCGAWTVEWQGIDGNWLPGATSIYQGIKQSAGSGTRVEYAKDANFSGLKDKADVGIVVVSEKPYAEGWGDIARPVLDTSDIQTIGRIKSSVRKVILISVTGRPLFMNDQIAGSDAMVAAWLPGSEGAGIADVLFGDQPFTARLPIAWPASPDQLPITTSGKTNNGTRPLFTRGFGL